MQESGDLPLRQIALAQRELRCSTGTHRLRFIYYWIHNCFLIVRVRAAATSPPLARTKFLYTMFFIRIPPLALTAFQLAHQREF